MQTLLRLWEEKDQMKMIILILMKLKNRRKGWDGLNYMIQMMNLLCMATS